MHKLKKGNKLHIDFHNPNSKEETVKFLTKLITTSAVEKCLSNDVKDYYSRPLKTSQL